MTIADVETTSVDRHTPSAAVSMTPRRDVALIWLAAIASVVAWIPIYRWYGLFDNEHNTHFAFEKIPGYFDSPIIRRTLALFILISVIYAFAIWLIRTLPAMSHGTRLGLVVLALGPALANIALYPVGALDVFNYMIELKLAFHFDQNPYLVTFEAYRSDPFALPAFLVDITLFYGPAWLALSWLPTAITGFSDVLTTLLGLKIFNLLLLGVTGWLIARYQDDSRRAWIAAFLFLANPLVLFEGIANVHNDVMMTLLLVGAFYALMKRSPLAGALLVLSALVKFNPLVLAPLFVAVVIRERWEWRRIAVTVLLALVAVVSVSTPWWGDGELVDGLRDGLSESQEMDHVSISSLSRQWFQEREASEAVPSIGNIIRASGSFDIVDTSTQQQLDRGFGAVIVALTLLIAIAVWRGAAAEPAAAATMLVLILFGTNFYAWYLIPVIALLALRIDRRSLTYVLIVTGTALAYYPFYVYAHFSTEWSRWEVHRFLSLFLTVPTLLYLVAQFLHSVHSKVHARSRNETHHLKPGYLDDLP